MSSIITGILKLTFGLFWDKLRDHTAEQLQHGDVTDQKCRQFIIRELDNIASVLEGLSRKDLLASISFLKEGVCLLNMIFETETNDVNPCELIIQENDESDTGGHSSSQMDGLGGESKSKQTLYVDERFEKAINKLSRIITNLDRASKHRLSSAIKSFADARCEATRAFNNTALSTKDRILASKLRVISRLLEDIEDPMAAIEACRLYLDELHKLEAIREIFSVHVNGGLKSRFNKQKRQELMSSVIMISYVLANFTLKFAGEKYNLFNWPKIELSRRSLHPLIDPTANAIMHSAKIGAPNLYVFDTEVITKDRHQENMPGTMTVGSGHIAEIRIRDGEMHFRLFHSLDEIDTDHPKILLVATNGQDDNMYVVAYVQISADEFDFSLLQANESRRITCKSNLEFLSQAEKNYRESPQADRDEIEESFLNRPTHVEFTVNTSAKISIFGHQTSIYVCDINGLLSHHFETLDRNDLIYITGKNHVITAGYSSNTISVYSINGSMKHKFNVTRGQVVYDVVCHHASHMIYALTRNSKGEFQLETYSHLGEHRGNLDLVGFNFSALLPMSEGPVAAIHDKGFILT